MNRRIASVALIPAAGLALAGCGGSSSSSTSAAASSPNVVAVSAAGLNKIYLGDLQEYGFDTIHPSAAIGLAHDTCKLFGLGQTYTSMESTMVTHNMTVADAQAVLLAAVQVYCPQYSSRLP